MYDFKMLVDYMLGNKVALRFGDVLLFHEFCSYLRSGSNTFIVDDNMNYSRSLYYVLNYGNSNRLQYASGEEGKNLLLNNGYMIKDATVCLTKLQRSTYSCDRDELMEFLF